MLKCRELAKMASNYIDDTLTPSEKLSIRIHLMMCGHCRTFIGNLRESVRFIEKHSSFSLDEEYARRLDERIAQALKMTPPHPDGQ